MKRKSKMWIYSYKQIVFRFVPESVRWLLAKEKNVQAKGIVCHVAKINKVKLSESLLDSFKEETQCVSNSNYNFFYTVNHSNGLLLFQAKAVEQMRDEVKILPVLKMMLKSRKLVIRFAIVFFIW